MTTATKQEKYSSSPPLSLDGGPNTRVEEEGAIVIVELHNNTFPSCLAAVGWALALLFLIYHLSWPRKSHGQIEEEDEDAAIATLTK